MSVLRRGVLIFSMVWLAACGERARPVADAPAAEAAPAPACVPLSDWQRPGERVLRVAQTTDERGHTLRFTVLLGGKTTTAAVLLPPEVAEAIADPVDEGGDATRVCADRWFIQNLQAERGGILVVAELRDGRLALGTLEYDSGDEDTAEITWGGSEPLVTTSANGTHALSALMAAAATTGPRTLECRSEEPRGTQLLTLELDGAGRLGSVSYSSITPGGNCSVDARRGEPEMHWTDTPGRTEIRWGEAAPGTSDAPRLLVTREGGGYALDMASLDRTFACGQSAEMALSIMLNPGEKTCSVQWPEAGPDNEDQ